MSSRPTSTAPSRFIRPGTRVLKRAMTHRNWLLLVACVLLVSGCTLVWLAPLQGIAGIVVAVLLGLSACTTKSTTSNDSSTTGVSALSVGDVTVGEADGSGTFTVTRGDSTAGVTSVDYATSDETATAESDYTAASGTLTFQIGETTQTFEVPILNDTAAEGDETFAVTLSNPVDAILSDASGVGTITDNDAGGTGALSVGDVTVGEADGSATFTVTRAVSTAGEATFDYATSDDTATAGSDYTAASGTLTFLDGIGTQTFAVTILEDAVSEGSETFNVTLANPVNATLSDGAGVGTISDNDAAPFLAIAGAIANEADGTATFTVTKTGSTALSVTVQYATADDSAKAGSDYTLTSGTLTFAAADTQQTISVPVSNDLAFEGAEVFTVTLANASGGTVATAKAIGVIRSNDQSALDVAAMGEAGIILSGANADDQAGTSVAGVGDFNGDGLADALVGAPNFDVGASSITNQGQGYMVFGKATGLADTALGSLAPPAGLTVIGPAASDFKNIGAGASSAGDVNRDGLGDLIIGGGGFDANGNDAVVLFGKGSGLADVDLSGLGSADGIAIAQQVAGDWLGRALSAAGDVNGDGVDDIVLGAPSATISSTSAGKSYLVFGKTSGLAGFTVSDNLSCAPAGFSILGSSNERSGSSVGGGGDFNGDGYADLIIGAPNANDSASITGRAYVILGGAGPSPDFPLTAVNSGVAGFRMSGQNAFNNAGTSVAMAGDVNGDGFDDLLIGAPGATVGSGNAEGKTYLVFGQSATPSNFTLSDTMGTTGALLFGSAFSGQAGKTVSGAGDVNGDGYDDILIGPEVTACGTQGFSYLVFGKASWGTDPSIDLGALSGTAGIKISGSFSDNVAPANVSRGGDLNGDGFADLIIGGPISDADAGTSIFTDEGKAFIVFGGDFRGDVTALGTSGDDILTGTSGADIMVGGRGNDVLTGAGGADALQGGAGDDLISVPDLSFLRVDGGLGYDGLQITGSGLHLDLSATPSQAGTRIRNIEGIELTGTGNNTLTLTPQAVSLLSAEMGRTDSGQVFHLGVAGNSGDVVNLNGVWTLNATQEVVQGVTFDRYDSQDVIVLILPAITVTIVPPG